MEMMTVNTKLNYKLLCYIVYVRLNTWILFWYPAVNHYFHLYLLLLVIINVIYETSESSALMYVGVTFSY